MRRSAPFIAVPLIMVASACAGPDSDEVNGFTAQESVSPAQAFVGAHIFDGTGAPVIENGVVVVRDGVIAEVGAAATVTIPEGAEVVDLEGRWLIPGIINGHGHVDGDRGQILDQLHQYAHYGVTTTVSLAGNEVSGIPVRNEQWTPELDRARLFVAAPTLNPPSPEQAREMVAELVEADVDWIKIHVHGGPDPGKMAPEIYEAVIAAGIEMNVPVAVHIVELEDAKGVLRAGGHLIGHSVRDQPVDQELIDLMLERDVCVTPTFTREVSTFIYTDRPEFFDDPFFLERAAPDDLDAFLTPMRRDQSQSAAAEYWRDALPLALENMMRLHEAGVGVAMGTDSGPPGRFQGYFEHVEMEMMVDAGMTPGEVLHSSTGEAARCVGLDGVVGTIEPGVWADLVALDANPLDDIRNAREIHGVWIAGNQVR